MVCDRQNINLKADGAIDQLLISKPSIRSGGMTMQVNSHIFYLPDF
ncbi:Uncharacterised protein [Vibrio cholerae]|nr:Uncharacterised protein [Vibrio cholerae]